MSNPTKKDYTELRSFLRRDWLKWRGRQEAFKINRTPYIGDNKRIKWNLTCMMCGLTCPHQKGLFKVDHVIPCGSLKVKEDLEEFVHNLFFGELQILCKDCHSVKTKEENEKLGIYKRKK